MCYVFHHPNCSNNDGSPIELYSVCRNCRINEEGPLEDLFNNPVERAEVAAAVEEAARLPDKIIEFRKGITINNNNQPAPENTVHDPNYQTGLYSPWGFNGICERRKEQLGKFDAKLEKYLGRYDPKSLFEHLFRVK
jgi:hypothetical protein